jgi:mevalonate kinase
VIALSWFASIILAALLGGAAVYNYMNKPIIPPAPKPVVSKPVKRPVDVTCEEMKIHLWHYDNDPFKIEWKTLEQKGNTLNMEIKGNLYQREFTQSAEVRYTIKSGRWKIGLGIGIGAALTVGIGYGAVKIYKELKK